MSVAVAITPASGQYGSQASIAVTGAGVATAYTLTLNSPSGSVKTWPIVTDGSGAFTQVFPVNHRGAYTATLTAAAVVDASVGTFTGT